MSIRDNTEELAWESIDALLNELDEVILYAIAGGVPAEDVAGYIQKEITTVKRRALRGYKRPFLDVYNEFLDELKANDRCPEYEEFLKEKICFTVSTAASSSTSPIQV